MSDLIRQNIFQRVYCIDKACLILGTVLRRDLNFRHYPVVRLFAYLRRQFVSIALHDSVHELHDPMNILDQDVIASDDHLCLFFFFRRFPLNWSLQVLDRSVGGLERFQVDFIAGPLLW